MWQWWTDFGVAGEGEPHDAAGADRDNDWVLPFGGPGTARPLEDLCMPHMWMPWVGDGAGVAPHPFPDTSGERAATRIALSRICP